MGQEHSIPSSNCDRHHHHHHTSSTKSSHHRRDHTPTSSRHSSYSSSSTNSKTSSISSTTSTSTKSSISSGYTSGSSRPVSIVSDRSGSDVLPLYKNVHYKDINNNDIYKPLKLSKSKLNKLKILNADKDTAIYLEKHLSIKSYVDKNEENAKKTGPKLPEPQSKKSGIRNYTPKILCEKDPKKDIEHWI